MNQQHARKILKVSGPLLEPLTDRELQVLSLVVQGMNNPAIANALNIRVHTTRSHLRNIYQKLSCHSRTEAAIKAIRLGLVH